MPACRPVLRGNLLIQRSFIYFLFVSSVEGKKELQHSVGLNRVPICIQNHSVCLFPLSFFGYLHKEAHHQMFILRIWLKDLQQSLSCNGRIVRPFVSPRRVLRPHPSRSRLHICRPDVCNTHAASLANNVSAHILLPHTHAHTLFKVIKRQ